MSEIVVRYGRAIPVVVKQVEMYVGGDFQGDVMLITGHNERDRFESLFGPYWDEAYDGMGFFFFAHRKWAAGNYGIDGPTCKHAHPAPRPGERWLCDLFLLKDDTRDGYGTRWIATPREFISQ